MSGSWRNFLTNWLEIRNKGLKNRPFNYQNSLVFNGKTKSLTGIQTLQVDRTRKLQETNYIQKISSAFNPPASK